MADSEYSLTLKKNFDVIKNRISQKNLKYYNFKTIENFIIHFEKLKDEEKRDAYERINNYLIFVKETNPYEVQENTVDLYNEFIYPLAYDYYIPIGFVPYARWVVIYILFIGLLLTLFIIGVPLILYPLILIILIVHHCYILHKKINNKVFGLRY